MCVNMEIKKTDIIKNNSLSTFKNKVLKIEYEKGNIDDFVLKNDLKYSWIVAIIVIFANLFWLIGDSRVQRGLDKPIIFYSLIFQVIISIVLLVLSLNHKKIHNISIIRYVLLFYYFFIVYVTTILIIQRNVLASASGVESYFVGISLSTCYLFIIVALPLPNIIDSILLIVSFIIGFFVPLFANGVMAYSIETHLVLRICLIFAYFAFRKYNTNLAKKNMEVIELNRELLIPSYIDFLTSAMNRRALDTYWEYLCQSDDVSNVGVVLFDVDYFKSYNDTYSHRKGDNILKEISSIVSGFLEEKNNFLFRYGGEEFIFIFVNTSKEEVLRFAQKIRKEVYDRDIKRNDIKQFDRITITCGCGLLEKEKMHKSDYITESDKQLYIGKRSCRNCVVFNDEIY